MNSANVTPRPTTDTKPPLPALQALVLTLAPPSETAVADDDADAVLAPEGEPVLVALTPLVEWPAALPPVACGRPVAPEAPAPPAPVGVGLLLLLLPPLLPF